MGINMTTICEHQMVCHNGFDTREAAFRVLAFPDFKAFIPQHALTLGQNYSLIYIRERGEGGGGIERRGRGGWGERVGERFDWEDERPLPSTGFASLRVRLAKR